MNKLSLRLLCQIYVPLVLLVVALLFTSLYSLLALGMILVVIFISLRPRPVRFRVVITIGFIFIIPLVLQPLLNSLALFAGIPLIVAQIMSAMSILPVIYSLDYELKQNAKSIGLFNTERPKGRYITAISRTLFMAALVILLVSIVLNNPTLLFTSIIFALYLLVILLRALFAIPRLPLEVSTLWKSVIAGATVNVSLRARSKASINLHSVLSPVEPWVTVTPQRFILSKDITELNITLTPPLAGPSHPRFKVSVMDPLGFIQVNQLLKPVELHVIPRAKYAEWLAKRYLEQTGAKATADSVLLPKTVPILKRGVDYFDSRTYQPGDQLKDIDWKHTLKLKQLVIKEYVETGGQATIIAVNLSVTNAEEADKLAFNLITAALTLAQEAIPTALTVYDQQKVVLTSGIIDPREVLKLTLSVIKDITTVEIEHRFLQLPDISKLRRDIDQLKQATSEPAQRLLNMLNFEYQSLKKAAKDHPATQALALATKHVPAPSMIILISQLNHDAEALLVTTEKLSRREFNVIFFETK